MWHGVQHLQHYKSCNTTKAEGDPGLAEELNNFFARFAVEGPRATSDCSSSSLSMQEHEVRGALRTVNPRKAAEPDGVTGWVLRERADQLGGVLTNIFNESLSHSSSHHA